MTLGQRIKSKFTQEFDPDEGKKIDLLKESNKHQRGLLKSTSEHLDAYLEAITSEITEV